jgi:hypothetical protein
MRWALLVSACVAVLFASAAAAMRMRWSGDLGGYGSAVGMPVHAGSAFSVGMSQLKADGRIRIESVRLERPTRGITFAGALVHPSGYGMVGAERQFPQHSRACACGPQRALCCLHARPSYWL